MAVLADDSQAVILVASPNADDAKVVKAAMQGSNVCHAQTCREALGFVTSLKCNVVLCDHLMPDGRWSDLLDEVTKLPNAPPVIVLSRVADECLWADVLGRGGLDLLSKPLERLDLRRALSSPQCGHAHARFTSA